MDMVIKSIASHTELRYSELCARLEQVNIRKLHSQVKIVGTIVTVGGAMIMTLIRGPAISLPWTRAEANIHSTTAASPQDPIKGSIMIAAGCFCWASFYTLQVGHPLIFPE